MVIESKIFPKFCHRFVMIFQQRLNQIYPLVNFQRNLQIFQPRTRPKALEIKTDGIEIQKD